MAHAFDTGSTKPQRTRIQQGAIALLSGLKRSNGGYLMEVLPFGGVIRSYSDEEGAAELVSLLSKAPSIAIALGDRTDRPVGMGGFGSWGEIDLLVYFSSNNARNAQIGRQEIDVAGAANDTKDPGLHVMMEHAVELLIGQRCGGVGDDIKQIRREVEQEIATTPAVTVWMQLYKITVLTQISEFRTVDQLLESIRFRVAANPNEVHLPAAATDHRTIDVNVDDLA